MGCGEPKTFQRSGYSRFAGKIRLNFFGSGNFLYRQQQKRERGGTGPVDSWQKTGFPFFS